MQDYFFFASHSLETLSERLGQLLEEELSLFQPPLIVIPHPSMKEWLQLELCKVSKNKAAVGLEFVSWTQALHRLGGVLPIPTKLELSAAAWKALSDGGSAPVSMSVTSKLTDLLEQYVDGFSFLEGVEACPEKELFQNILSSHGWKTYPDAIQSISAPVRSVILFGIDFLPPPIHQFFLSLPNIQVFRFSPCAMFWEDFCTASERKKILRKWNIQGITSTKLQALDELLRDSQRLLSNWGVIGRKMLSDTKLSNDGETNYAWEGGDTLLNALKVDLLFLEKPNQKFSLLDRSIHCVKTGASRFLEIQWLGEEILRLVAGGMNFSDIRVYAPNVSVYAPIIEFTFDEIPYRISDLDISQRSDFYQAITEIFQCVRGRWEANFVLGLVKRPSFLRKVKWSSEEVERIGEWVAMAKIRWGIDRVHKKETSAVEGAPSDAGSWENGWRKMLRSLLFLENESECAIGWGEFDLFENFYETFVLLQTTLLGWREDKTLISWANEIEGLVSRTLDFDNKLDTDVAAKNSLDRFIEGLRKTSLKFPEEKFPFKWVESSFFSPSGDEGRSLLNSVRFSSLKTGSIFPAKCIILIGMDEDSFPQSLVKGSLQSKFKDAPRPSDFDRYVFLQAIFCAKEKLICSYGDSSKEDGKPVSPSLLVQELFSYLDSAFLFSHDKKPSEILITKAQVLAIDSIERQSLWKNSLYLPELPESPSSISIRELAKFFRHPPQYYIQQVLGIEVQEEPDSEWKDFELNALTRHLLLTSFLKKEICLDKEMPLGMFGDIAKKNLVNDMDQFKEHFKNWDIDPGSIYSLVLNGKLYGEVLYCVPEGVLHVGKDDIGGLLRKWPELLGVLSQTSTKKIFCLRSGKIREVTDVGGALQLAIDLFLRCQKSPCFLHAEWADSVLRKNRPPEMDQIKDAVLKWIIERSPSLDIVREMNIWKSTFSETFLELISLFPVRGQNAEI